MHHQSIPVPSRRRSEQTFGFGCLLEGGGVRLESMSPLRSRYIYIEGVIQFIILFAYEMRYCGSDSWIRQLDLNYRSGGNCAML